MGPLEILAIIVKEAPVLAQLLENLRGIKENDPALWAKLVEQNKAADAHWDAAGKVL